MCADRIAYNIHTAVMLKLLNEKEVNEIINNLRFEENKWFFTSRKIAKKFAMIPLILTEHLWGCADTVHLLALVLRRCKLGVALRDRASRADASGCEA